MIGLVAIGTAFEAFITLRGGKVSLRSGQLWAISFSYAVAWWVETDRRSRNIPAPFEYAAFMFFMWPVLLLPYLFKSRGWRGFALGIGVILFSCIPDLTGLVMSALA
jgi:hypothetical protein